MTRQELLESPDYWLSGAAVDIWRASEDYRTSNGIDLTEYRKFLEIPEKDFLDLMSGDLIPGRSYYQVACKIGLAPVMELKNKEEL